MAGWGRTPDQGEQGKQRIVRVQEQGGSRTEPPNMGQGAKTGGLRAAGGGKRHLKMHLRQAPQGDNPQGEQGVTHRRLSEGPGRVGGDSNPGPWDMV